ncbi:hypothetical protein GGI17_006484 [Coemansia sp. S146]|nr:hypothetical protein GGI17_006484 [Coemansia sp. S146]
MAYLQVFNSKTDLESYVVNATISKKCMVLMVRYPEFLRKCRPRVLNGIEIPSKLLAISMVADGCDNALYIGNDARAVEDELVIDPKYFVVPIECPTSADDTIKDIEKVLDFYNDQIPEQPQ